MKIITQFKPQRKNAFQIKSTFELQSYNKLMQKYINV